MAENTEEEHLDNLTNTQAENLSDVITPYTDTESINPNQETEKMEVHHHPHVEKKNFKEYLLEGLMIFLAVTMGFFAESYREHLAEVNKENDYIQTFIEDLKTDTATIKKLLITEQNVKLKSIDSLLFLLNTHQIKGHENDLYYFGRAVTRYPIFQSNDRTVTQLKNSGGLRLIRNAAASDSIINYEKEVQFIYRLQEDENEERKDLYPILCQMYDPFIFDKMVEGFNITRPNDNPSLRSYDTKIQKDLAFYISEIKESDYLTIIRLQKLETKAEDAIAFLQKEYHLDN
jgi:hypothetical protein